MAADAPAAEPRPGWRRAWLALALSLLAVSANAGAAGEPRAVDAARELQVEAAFLVNFIRYTDWPPGRFASAGAPYVVVVVGSDRDIALFSGVANAAGSIGGRRIVVHRADPGEMRVRATALRVLQGSHAVFVRDGSHLSCQRLRGLLDGAPVLTVGDAPGFAADGGMIGLVRVDRHLAFEANPGAIRAAGLAVSAKVLKLARLRETQP